MKKLLSLCLVVFILLTGCSKEEKIQTVIIDEKLLKIYEMTPEEAVEDLKMNGSENYTEIVANEDDSVSLKFNETQKQFWVDSRKKGLETGIEGFQRAGNKQKVSISEDNKTIDMYVNLDLSVEDLTFYMLFFETNCAFLQLLENEEGYEWYVKINVYNAESEKLVKSGDSNTGLTITTQDWNNSK